MAEQLTSLTSFHFFPQWRNWKRSPLLDKLVDKLIEGVEGWIPESLALKFSAWHSALTYARTLHNCKQFARCIATVLDSPFDPCAFLILLQCKMRRPFLQNLKRDLATNTGQESPHRQTGSKNENTLETRNIDNSQVAPNTGVSSWWFKMHWQTWRKDQGQTDQSWPLAELVGQRQSDSGCELTEARRFKLKLKVFVSM